MPPEQWTAELLKEHFEQRFLAQERAVAAALAAQEKATAAALQATKDAVLKAEAAAERRFEGQNEFRGQLSDQARMLIPRTEAEAYFRSNREKIEGLERRVEALSLVQASQAGEKGGKADSWGRLLGAVGLIAGLIGIAASLAR